MKLELIAKIENALVFRAGRGKYITAVCDTDPDDGEDRSRIYINIPWTTPLGRWAFSVTKCSDDPLEEKAIELIRKNKDKILKKLSEYDEFYKEHPEKLEEVEEESDEYLAELEDGQTVTY